jgi:Sulfotransferase family
MGVCVTEREIIYIGGEGRSGSTVLEGLLGASPGSVSVGELRDVWSKGLEYDHLCGCGKRFSSCDFWQDVLKEAFASESRNALTAHVRHLQRRLEAPRSLPRLYFPSLRERRFTEAMDDYGQILERLYGSIARVSSAERVLDSSKYPAYAMVLSQIESFDLRLVHLVRDSRGVAHSWRRTSIKPDVPQSRTFMPRKGPLKAALRWDYCEAAFRALSRRVPTVRVRYEDLATSVESELQDLATWLGLETWPVPEGGVSFDGHHAIGGNPVRFTEGPVPLKMDNEWAAAMPARDRALVTALTWPGLMAEGYRLRVSRRRAQ